MHYTIYMVDIDKNDHLNDMEQVQTDIATKKLAKSALKHWLKCFPDSHFVVEAYSKKEKNGKGYMGRDFVCVPYHVSIFFGKRCYHIFKQGDI